MKQLLLPILCATFFVACDQNSEYPASENEYPASKNQADSTEVGNENVVENPANLIAISIKERPCETLEYAGKIGHDFDSALDSLRNLKAIISEVYTLPLEVLFDYDNRQFYGITYGECGMYADVLDTKGNHYLRTYYCPDENVIEEEAIFKNNTTFYGGRYHVCSRIIYKGRIGGSFNFALDSLKIMYKQWLEPYGEDGYYIEKEKVYLVDFSEDSRGFFLLYFKDNENGRWIIDNIVIDEKGNLFDFDIYCKD
jgi:hypothetical protein